MRIISHLPHLPRNSSSALNKTRSGLLCWAQLRELWAQRDETPGQCNGIEARMDVIRPEKLRL